ncbi:peptidoglycan editing factor PgeF [Collinsella vaginalis]|uniref:peptidoglycan editing factor PgeF n=1 Tax=Collinsella vaginalis TaxID=1870987 RepID=UPI000A272946|nr:peptidoglycan editing factor PgeF [Collinsella vaginalis]
MEGTLKRETRQGVTLVGELAGSVRFGFTERTGGMSEPPFTSLNLGGHVGDDPAAVAENRRRVLAALGVDAPLGALLVPNQVHGDHVALVDDASPAALARVRDEIAAGADAIVCSVPGVPVLLCFADCVPVILTLGDAFAVVHSGWKGTRARISAKAARVLAETVGKDIAGIRAWIGPHIRGDEYEVSPELMADFAATFDAVRPAAAAGSRLLDLAACIREALTEAGVPGGSIRDAGLSTLRDNDRFFSYRAEHGRCGRHGAVAVITGRAL